MKLGAKCAELLGQDELAQLGGLQAVDRAVVADGDRFLTLKQGAAVYGTRNGVDRMGRVTVCTRDGQIGWDVTQERGGGQSGLHEEFSCCVAVRFANDNDSQLLVKRFQCFFLFFFK